MQLHLIVEFVSNALIFRLILPDIACYNSAKFPKTFSHDHQEAEIRRTGKRKNTHKNNYSRFSIVSMGSDRQQAEQELIIVNKELAFQNNFLLSVKIQGV